MVNPLRVFNVEDKEIKLRKVITPKHIATYAKKLSGVRKDTPIIVTGYPGEGKSVLAREIAKTFDKRYTDERNCIYTREEFMSKVESFPPSAFVLDEAINLLYKREWNTGAQKEMVKILNICRSKKHLIIFVQPEFIDLDKDIRNGRIRLWIYAIKRGVSAVFKPERSLGGGEDPWNITENNKIVKRFVTQFGQTIGTIEGAFRTKNFLTYLRWGDIPKEEYEVYEKVKDEKKYSDLGQDIRLTQEQSRREGMKVVFEVYALLESQGKIKKGAKGITVSYLQTSDGTASNLIRQARIKLGLMKDQMVNDADINLDEGDIVQI